MYFRLKINSHQSLIEQITAISAAVTSLSLSSNNLVNLRAADLAQALAAIPVTVTSLSLLNNRLGYLSGTDLIKVLAAIPVTVTSLDLSDNRLVNLGAAALVKVLAAILPTVTSLSLSNNSLGYLSGTDLIKVLAAIPVMVTSLDLSDNHLVNLGAAALVKVLSAILPTVTSLNLDWNDLGKLNAAALEQVFRAIPATVTSLSLGGNKLGDKNGAVLAKVFAAIPSSVYVIYLRNNYFHKMSVHQLKLLKDSLPNATTVYLSNNNVEAMSEDQLLHLAQMMPKAINVKVVDCHGNSVTREKVKYLQSKAGEQAIDNFIMLVDKARGIPYDISSLISEFLVGSQEKGTYAHVDLRMTNRYLNKQYEAFKNDEKIDIGIEDPKFFRNRLEDLNNLMEIANNSSRFSSWMLFRHKNDRQKTIREQALETAEAYVKTEFKENEQKELEYWKKMTEEPTFNMQRRAFFFHSRDGYTATVKQIAKDKITPLEPGFTLSRGR